ARRRDRVAPCAPAATAVGGRSPGRRVSLAAIAPVALLAIGAALMLVRPRGLPSWVGPVVAAVVAVAGPLDPKARLPWYGPSMGARSFITARLMETWAHGQDVADALDFQRRPTDRLRHVADIGVRTFNFSFDLRGLERPTSGIFVELAAPSGGTWTWGDPASEDVVRGDALDFCQLVTQRRHLDDLDLEITGQSAQRWASIAQAYAGAPGPGRAPSTGSTAPHDRTDEPAQEA
ncbi:MAG: maleylpyruvate isomerase family mycothiol-dependent enzyme, partial [Propionibacteriales bacterium]|nr:maleylpyruvate isomerase family mycothiol-dependent enzyme [Propionibacteriales bacterium]